MDYRNALLEEFGQSMNTAPADPRMKNLAGERISTPGMQAPSEEAAPNAAPAPAAPKANTRLMEGNAEKLNDPSHALKSPKYAFLQLANSGKYGYDQLGDMLKELQGGASGRFFQGWTADGDKLRYAGDKSQLAPEWNGVDIVDAIGGFKSGNPQGWRWGADEAEQLMRAQSPGGSANLQGSLNSLLTGSPTMAISNAMNKYTGQSDYLKALLAQLGQGQ